MTWMEINRSERPGLADQVLVGQTALSVSHYIYLSTSGYGKPWKVTYGNRTSEQTIRIYEPPALVELGEFGKDTLGSGGTAPDGYHAFVSRDWPL